MTYSPKIGVITPTIPGRESLLRECRASVEDQIYTHYIHLVGLAPELPVSVARNALCAAADDARCEWFAFLDDDDLFDREHLSSLVERAEDNDIVYSWGRGDGWDISAWHRGFDRHLIMRTNWIPVTLLIRASLFWRLGGFHPNVELEDWDLWKRATQAGARWHNVPRETWTYRWWSDEQRTRQIQRARGY